MVAYSFKKRFVPNILEGLKPRPGGAVHPKRQTIRAGAVGPDGIAYSVKGRRHARLGDVVQLYTAMRTKQCRKLGEAICVGVRPVTLRLSVGGPRVSVRLGGVAMTREAVERFTRDDGFDGPSDMVEFWQKENGADPGGAEWHGVLIAWEPLT